METFGTRSQPAEQPIDERNEDYPTFETERVILLQLRYSFEGVTPTVAPNGPLGISTLSCLPFRRIPSVLERSGPDVNRAHNSFIEPIPSFSRRTSPTCN